MAITVLEAQENRLLDVDLAEIIPTHCHECGTELMLTESLKQLYCPNRQCPTKVASRLEAMAKMMQVDGWGESTCLEVVRQFGMFSPFQVFLLIDKLDSIKTESLKDKIRDICRDDVRTVKLWEVAKYANIPSIDTVAFKLFDGFDSMESAFKAFENSPITFVADRLGLRNAETGVMAYNIYQTLIEYKDELLFGESMFNVYNPGGEKLCMAITGGVVGFSNKSEFVNYINSRYNGKVNAVLMTSVTKEVQVLVADGDTSSNKYRRAMKIKEAGGDIMIFESQELLRYLDDKYNV